MKISFFTLLVFILSCNCVVKTPPIDYPDKNLQEFIIYGKYRPTLEEFKTELLNRPICPKNDWRTKDCGLVEGETFEEALKNRFTGVGKEGFTYSGSYYCYNKTEEYKKPPIYKKNLKIKLYDKQGNLLSEDFLRQREKSPIPDFQSVYAYVPYHENAGKIYITKQEDKKEVIIKDLFLGFPTQTELRKRSALYKVYNDVGGWTYKPKEECHLAPPTR